MPREVEQCFAESGLLDPWQEEIIGWWLGARQLSRARHAERLSMTGHQAEKLSCEYEAERTGQAPEWVGLDTNFAGYDVLSQLSKDDATKLRIEVKGSQRRPKEADFVISRNESETARIFPEYVLHLWYLGSRPQLFIVPFSEIDKHLPHNRGSGSWEATRVPYTTFNSFRVV